MFFLSCGSVYEYMYVWMNCLYCMVLGYILIMTSFYFSVKFHFLILVVRNLFILSNIEKQKKVRCRLASEMGSITSNNNQNVENTDSTSVANDNAANSESSAASQATAKSSTPVVGMYFLSFQTSHCLPTHAHTHNSNTLSSRTFIIQETRNKR
jgi:hypothetical protein